MGDLSFYLFDRLGDIVGLSVDVVDQILTSLEALGRKRPEKCACTDLVKLDEVVIYKALVDVLDALKDNTLLGSNFFDLL